MIRADEIICQIADPNAVKVELIDCSTSLIDSAKGLELMWLAVGSIGAFFAMVITIFMARYAWKAWNTSQDQLELTREIALEQQRLPALAEFIKALRLLVFVDTSKDDVQTARALAREASLHAELWTISYKKIFDSNVVPKIITEIENDIIWCYHVLSREDQKQVVPRLTPNLFAVIGAVAESTKLFISIRETSYDLHRRHISEAEALKNLESSLKAFLEYRKSKD